VRGGNLEWGREAEREAKGCQEGRTNTQIQRAGREGTPRWNGHFGVLGEPLQCPDEENLAIFSFCPPFQLPPPQDPHPPPLPASPVIKVEDLSAVSVRRKGCLRHPLGQRRRVAVAFAFLGGDSSNALLGRELEKDHNSGICASAIGKWEEEEGRESGVVKRSNRMRRK